MSEPVTAYPLQWPPGWRREPYPSRAKFHAMTSRDNGAGSSWKTKSDLTIPQAIARVRFQLRTMGIDEADVVISTNLPLRRDGLPRGDARVPRDPGAAVYWRHAKATRCMAVDRYDRIQDNLAAIAATLEAMRAIERHGGAAILDRAFTGFTALPAPEQWFQVLGVPADATRQQIADRYRQLASEHHPDRGGSHDTMSRINTARDDGLAQAGP